uniref:Uncharacterized protein n=1 Tax=Arundo donax TaxID=35708 RepID=A0A0A9GMJ9_ARUDO
MTIVIKGKCSCLRSKTVHFYPRGFHAQPEFKRSMVPKPVTIRCKSKSTQWYFLIIVCVISQICFDTAMHAPNKW